MNRRTGGKEKEKLIQHDDGDNDGNDASLQTNFQVAHRKRGWLRIMRRGH